FVVISLLLGVILGIIVGIIHTKIFKLFHMRDTVKVLWIFSIAFLMIILEQTIKTIVPLSGLIAVMTFGVTIHHMYPVLAKRLHLKFEKIWVIAEIMLFVLVGAA